jgi:hypothetical protein
LTAEEAMALMTLIPNIFYTPKPWGAREFALLDKSGVCVILQQ